MKVALGNIEIAKGRAVRLREAVKEPRRAARKTWIVLELNGPKRIGRRGRHR